MIPEEARVASPTTARTPSLSGRLSGSEQAAAFGPVECEGSLMGASFVGARVHVCGAVRMCVPAWQSLRGARNE